jgi:hypothetical protein
VGSAEGQIPGVDVHDADSSSRYAAVRAFSVNDDGEVVEDYNEIVTLHRASISAELYAAISAGKDPPPEHAVAPVVRAALVDTLGTLDADAVVHVQARTRGPETEMLQIARNRAVALGLIETQSDRVSFDALALEEKRDMVAEYLDPILAEVEELGGTVVYQCLHAGCFDVLIPAGAVDALAAHPEITTLDTVHQMDAATNTVNGVGIEQVYQTKQYMDHSAVYDGDSWGSSTSVAIMEFQEYFDEHPVFKESSATTTRILTRRECDSNSCSNVTNFAGAGSHATFTASLLFGDLTDGQDPNVTDATDRRRKSSGGREARSYLYYLNTAASDAMRTAFDDLVLRNPLPVLVSNSIPYSVHDQACQGTDGISQDLDEVLYENSILMVVAAGNSGGTSSDCRVWAPGSALGAFTVGGWGPDSAQGTFNDWCDARAAALNENSSWGGNATEGRGRTIIDALGSYWHDNVALTSGGYGLGSGTSAATPAVAGAMVDFYDMYRVEHGTWVDNPGALFAWMLNMGDRDTSGVHIVEEFDGKWGAGRFRLRMLNDEGMDGPWGMATIETCVDHGEFYTYEVNGGTALPDDADSIRATDYWYDTDFHDGNANDDIDLWLVGNSGQTLRASNSAGDEKERVFYRDIGGHDTLVQLYGYSVTSDDQGCGTNSMRVYLTIMWEDDDRDDANGPTWNATDCTGVDTW